MLRSNRLMCADWLRFLDVDAYSWWRGATFARVTLARLSNFPFVWYTPQNVYCSEVRAMDGTARRGLADNVPLHQTEAALLTHKAGNFL